MSEWSGLEKAREMLAKIKKDRRYQKANNSRQAAAQLQYDLTVCRSQLEGSRTDLDRVIRVQSRNIQAGEAQGADTSIQRRLLQEAALGYLLIKDAIYALTTISSYDSISYAYEVLDAAVEQLSNKPKKMRKLSDLPAFCANRRRNGYEALSSPERQTEKELLCERMMPELIRLGDIETVLQRTQQAGNTQGRPGDDFGPGGPGSLADLMSQIPDDAVEEDNLEVRRLDVSGQIDDA